MATDLLRVIQNMFLVNSNRKKINGPFTPYFYRIIGVKNNENYDDVLATLKKKCDEHNDCTVVFDGQIPLSGEMELIEYIYGELNSMNVNNICNEEIIIFDDTEINQIFLQSLQYVILLAIKNENFFNETVRNNFITKLIVWTYSWVKNINMKSEINPKCIYYGNIEKHEVYFLIMLYKMGYDVLYLNPLKEEYWDKIDIDKLSTCYKEQRIVEIESFDVKSKRGKEIEVVETITKQIQRNIHEELFSDTGMYKPWQFRSGYTKSILLDTILEDIYIYWNEPAKLRDGFKVENGIVTVPCFFYKIDGQYSDIMENQKLLKYCINSKNTLFYNNGNISNNIAVSNEMYELMFCQLSDGTYDINEIKKCKVYTLSKYSEELQNFILNKFNELILDKSILKMDFDKEKSLQILVLILSLNEKIIRLIDNFDFVFDIPKIVIYLNNEDSISENMVILLAYLHKIGIDIVIFNPSGLFNINKFIKEEKINIIRLEEIKYDCNFNKIINHKQGFFARLIK